MRRYLLLAAGIALFILCALPAQQLNAQVYSEFSEVKVALNPYVELTGDMEINANQFVRHPNGVVDLNDGYAKIGLDQFMFEFNGEVYDSIWVSVNGFITFGNKVKRPNGQYELLAPPTLFEATRDPAGMFIDGASYPVNVIAPFWGDHYYRTSAEALGQQFAQTKISYKSNADEFIIQWKNLNINYIKGTTVYKASVADFQLILHKSTDIYTKQGNIEFRYGQVGKRASQGNLLDETVITTGAAVGVKGESITVGSNSDFLNCLYNGDGTVGYLPFDPYKAYTMDTKTTEWTPAGNNAYSIIVSASTRFHEDEWWGDGDVDFSRKTIHQNVATQQNRFVTINDARLIMRSVASGLPLDPIRRRQAYHADVNHNGRYYYLTRQDATYLNIGTIANPVFTFTSAAGGFSDIYGRNAETIEIEGNKDYKILSVLNDTQINVAGIIPININNANLNWTLRKSIFWSDNAYAENLPNPIGSIKQVLFEANEMDAALIIHYIGAKVSSLPWILDTTIQHGKIVDRNAATAVNFGKSIDLGNSMYQIPVYLNGNINGLLGVKFAVDAKIISVDSKLGANSSAIFDANTNTVVMAASGNYNADEPIAMITIESDKEDITFSSIRFNGNTLADAKQVISSVTSGAENVVLAASPNPFVSNVTITVNAVNTDNYTLAVYDMRGNIVKTLANGELSGLNTFVWDGKDASGNNVDAGVYIYRLIGTNNTISNKIILNK